MQPKIAALAAKVIARAAQGQPADQLLRQELKAARPLLREEAGKVSRAVFGYFRWKNWLSDKLPLAEQICEASRLSDVYLREPGKVADSELVERAVPAWVHREVTVTPGWARALQTEPRLWLRARPGQGRALARKLGEARAFGHGRLADAVEYCGQGDLFSTPEFHAGEFEIQDIGSQAVGLICAPHAGETWWDACAGQGGKLLHLSDLMDNRGLIWASDRAAWRLKILKRRAARARVFNYRAAIWNGGPRLPTRTLFDGTLVDAPCSGLGTWQRNPDARWAASLEDVRQLAALQAQLLHNAGKAVKPQAKLVYSVCTLTRSETRGVVEAFDKSEDEFTALPLSSPLRPGSAPEHGLFVGAEQFGGNGMFVAAWVRNPRSVGPCS